MSEAGEIELVKQLYQSLIIARKKKIAEVPLHIWILSRIDNCNQEKAIEIVNLAIELNYLSPVPNKKYVEGRRIFYIQRPAPQ